jgi:hypothetical protein
MVSPSKFEPETHCGGASGDGEDQSILKFVELGAIKLASTDLPACRITSGFGPLTPPSFSHSDAPAAWLAVATDHTLLFKGDDFIHTDIRPALPPAPEAT